MSAILEALKKLEQETTEPTGNPLRPEVRYDRGWRWTSLAGGVMISVGIFALAGYGALVLTRKASVAPAPETAVMDLNIAPPSRTAAVSSVSEPAPAARPVPNPVMAEPSRQDAVPAKTETPRQAKEIPPPARDVVAVALDPGDSSPKTIEETTLPHETMSDGHAKEPVPEDRGALVDGREVDSAVNTAQDIVPETLPNIIHDSEAVLQAISWSQDAGRRMAVINGKICREGEPIGGYVILKINPEDVVVSKGGVTGRLVFKIH